MGIVESILLGLLQGLTEFLPVSSSGHLVLGHAIFGAGTEDLAFDALLHFATAAAIVVYFRADIWKLIIAAYTVMQRAARCVFKFQISNFKLLSNQEKEVLALIAGTVPAIILGLFLEDAMGTLFRNPLLVAVTLIVGAVIMFAAERYAKRSQEGVLATREGLIVGLFQALALVPGMSRSGMTIAGGMFLGLTRQAAARFGFLLGAPILLGAGAKKILDLETEGALFSNAPVLIVGTLASFISGMLVIHYLLKFLRSHTLYPFIIYRVVLAIAIVIVYFTTVVG